MSISHRLDALAQRAHDPLAARFPQGDAAVLVLIVDDPRQAPGLVLTRRRSELRTDPGRVAFPGGRVDPGESIQTAALRECEEEVGIPSRHVVVHGRLDDSWNGAGFRIVPVVASVRGPVRLRPREAEVGAAAVVPLDAVMDDNHHEIVTTKLDGQDFLDDVIDIRHGAQHWRLSGPTADIARDLAAWLAGHDRRAHVRRQTELDHFATARGW